ncbi:calcium-binding protein [Microvirga aerilata]|uniref:calcium-binding protein n=1 Tax=Microvirga aerilata TaxID=670292 RepID=UPI003634B712
MTCLTVAACSAVTPSTGEGSDTYRVYGSEVLNDSGSGLGDIDTALAMVSYTLGENAAGIEVLQAQDGVIHINLTGNSQANRLVGNLGDNRLDGAGGADRMQGKAGNDTYVIDHDGDRVEENAGEGNDLVQANRSYTLTANVEHLETTNASGTGAFTLTGNTLANRITGNEGDNYLSGLENNDTLIGGGGNDILNGGEGIDLMEGGAGDDTYYVNSRFDEIKDDAGLRDRVITTISYTLTDERLEELEAANAGTSTDPLELTGNTRDNKITGNVGNNVLTGDKGNDTLIGGGGHDVFKGGEGMDSMEGGAGNDTYYVDFQDSIKDTGGTDTLVATTGGTYKAMFGIENLKAADNIANIWLVGDGEANDIAGNDLDNTLEGGGGNDHLTGRAGNDVLIGGAGNDTLEGGQGDDVYYADSGDTIIDGLGSDTLMITTAGTHTLTFADIENLQAKEGIDGIHLIGDGAANTLTGNERDNTLDGGAGADIMNGGDGNDVYHVRDLNDVVIEHDGTNGGIDTVYVYEKGFDVSKLVNVENIVIMYDQTLGGGGGNDTLNGGGGNDTLSGGGNDTYYIYLGDEEDVIAEDKDPAKGGSNDKAYIFVDSYELDEDVGIEVLAVGEGFRPVSRCEATTSPTP